MLVSHHAALSTAAALIAAPRVKQKRNLVLFLAAAVGQDVDHYLWHALKFRNPSLRDAYHYFASRYGQSPRRPGKRSMRAFHGSLPLALAFAASAVDRRLLPIALGMAFHGALDGVNELFLLPREKAGRQTPANMRAGFVDSVVEKECVST